MVGVKATTSGFFERSPLFVYEVCDNTSEDWMRNYDDDINNPQLHDIRTKGISLSFIQKEGQISSDYFMSRMLEGVSWDR